MRHSRRAASPVESHLIVVLAGRPVDVTVVRSSRRRRTIALSVGATGIRVLAPASTPDERIEEIVGRRAAWIERRVDHSTSANPATLQSGGLLPFRGELLRLVVHSGGTGHTVARTGNELAVSLLDAAPGGEETLRHALAEWYRAQAAEVLPGLAQEWASKSGLVPGRVIVRDQRRRWGSCGADGTIRLNWRLVMLEPDLADYVICHELAHLRHRHHQPPFWEQVARLIPDHRERRKRLNAAVESTRRLD